MVAVLSLIIHFLNIFSVNIFSKVMDYLNAPGFVGSISGYTRAKSEEVKVRMQDKISFILSKVAILAAIFLMFLFLLLFASLTASQYLNSVMDSNFAGYGIVSLFYLLMVIILFLIKNVESLNNFIRGVTSKIVESFKEIT